MSAAWVNFRLHLGIANLNQVWLICMTFSLKIIRSILQPKSYMRKNYHDKFSCFKAVHECDRSVGSLFFD